MILATNVARQKHQSVAKAAKGVGWFPTSHHSRPLSHEVAGRTCPVVPKLTHKKKITNG